MDEEFNIYDDAYLYGEDESKDSIEPIHVPPPKPSSTTAPINTMTTSTVHGIEQTTLLTHMTTPTFTEKERSPMDEEMEKVAVPTENAFLMEPMESNLSHSFKEEVGSEVVEEFNQENVSSLNQNLIETDMDDLMPMNTDVEDDKNQRIQGEQEEEEEEAEKEKQQQKSEDIQEEDDVLEGYGEGRVEEASVSPPPTFTSEEQLSSSSFHDPTSSVLPLIEQIYTDANSTSAIIIDELSWWTSDKDIIQIATLATKDSHCVKEVSFAEHKVNGKSRGTAWVLFNSVEAAAKTKAQFESIEIDQRIPMVSYSDPLVNPFRTLPKDSHSKRTVGPGSTTTATTTTTTSTLTPMNPTPSLPSSSTSSTSSSTLAHLPPKYPRTTPHPPTNSMSSTHPHLPLPPPPPSSSSSSSSSSSRPMIPTTPMYRPMPPPSSSSSSSSSSNFSHPGPPLPNSTFPFSHQTNSYSSSSSSHLPPPPPPQQSYQQQQQHRRYTNPNTPSNAMTSSHPGPPSLPPFNSMLPPSSGYSRPNSHLPSRFPPHSNPRSTLSSSHGPMGPSHASFSMQQQQQQHPHHQQQQQYPPPPNAMSGYYDELSYPPPPTSTSSTSLPNGTLPPPPSAHPPHPPHPPSSSSSSSSSTSSTHPGSYPSGYY